MSTLQPSCASLSTSSISKATRYSACAIPVRRSSSVGLPGPGRPTRPTPPGEISRRDSASSSRSISPAAESCSGSGLAGLPCAVPVGSDICGPVQVRRGTTTETKAIPGTVPPNRARPCQPQDRQLAPLCCPLGGCERDSLFARVSGHVSRLQASVFCLIPPLTPDRTCDDRRTCLPGAGHSAARAGGRGLAFMIFGLRVYFRTIGQGTFHCHRCGGDRQYHLRSGRRWIHVIFIPVIRLGEVGEHVQCANCQTRYRPEVRALPTSAQMLAALPAGMRAAAAAMLRAGDASSGRARRRAMDAVKAAGLADYDDMALDGDLDRAAGPGFDIAAPMNALAVQLVVPAREWFLADVVRIDRKST